MLEITDKIFISEDDLVFKFSRSSGPGGQNVNKVSTRVTVFYDLMGSESFTQQQKNRIRKKLATRVDKGGRLRVACQRGRTQKSNREGAVERLVELLAESLNVKAIRKKTKMPFSLLWETKSFKTLTNALHQYSTPR